MFRLHSQVSSFVLFLSCACAFGFHGTFCEVNVDDCEDHGCESGATCVDGVGNYTCLCPPNYTGTKAASEYLLHFTNCSLREMLHS